MVRERGTNGQEESDRAFQAGLKGLKPVDPNALAAFEREMTEETIPAMLRDAEKRRLSPQRVGRDNWKCQRQRIQSQQISRFILEPSEPFICGFGTIASNGLGPLVVEIRVGAQER